MAFSLLTGLRPWQVALEQGQSWAHFQEAHFGRLSQALRDLPLPMVEAWAEQLGVPPAALVKNLPPPNFNGPSELSAPPAVAVAPPVSPQVCGSK